MKRVLIVGSAEQSGGGVASVIRLMKKMPVWEKYRCCWLGTQIQRNYAWKLWYAVKANVKAVFIIWRYDIIHFHAVPDINGMIIQLPVFLLALVGRKKVVIHLHVGNQLTGNTDNRLFIWLLRKSDCILLLAEKWKDLFDRLYVDALPMYSFTTRKVLYNACESVVEVPFAEKEKCIIMAAYFCDNKAPDILLKAWKEIHDDYPDWKVYMLGNGEVERFRRMSHELGISDSVTFTGYVSGEERERFLRRASIYCMCSYEEGFPMVVLESWMYGINVVTTPVGGLPDVIEEGRNCLTFGFGDHAGLAQKLRLLMDDERRRKDMADYSRKFVMERFSLEKINKDIEEIYEEF